MDVTIYNVSSFRCSCLSGIPCTNLSHMWENEEFIAKHSFGWKDSHTSVKSIVRWPISTEWIEKSP